MRVGLQLGYLGVDGITVGEQRARVAEAERLGYDSVWAIEGYGADAPSLLGWAAQATERVSIGSAVMQIPARSAAATAGTVANLDQLSDGRAILGLGSSGPQVAEGWHGQPFDRQLLRTREYIDVVRMALARHPVELQGETLRLPLRDGEGKALRLLISPVQERLPIYLAALGPRNVALAGEVADGWLPLFFDPDMITAARPLLEEGASRAGRSLDRFAICPTVDVHVSEDVDAARDAMRPQLALYIGAMGSARRNFYADLLRRWHPGDLVDRVQELYRARRVDEAQRLLSDELVDRLTLCGPPERVAAGLARYAAAGVHTLIVAPRAASGGERLEQVRAVAGLLARD
jgi:F420-dependent oxidoreductase-like protein